MLFYINSYWVFLNCTYFEVSVKKVGFLELFLRIIVIGMYGFIYYYNCKCNYYLRNYLKLNKSRGDKNAEN